MSTMLSKIRESPLMLIAFIGVIVGTIKLSIIILNLLQIIQKIIFLSGDVNLEHQ